MPSPWPSCFHRGRADRRVARRLACRPAARGGSAGPGRITTEGISHVPAFRCHEGLPKGRRAGCQPPPPAEPAAWLLIMLSQVACPTPEVLRPLIGRHTADQSVTLIQPAGQSRSSISRPAKP
jgi:hypothetical protein